LIQAQARDAQQMVQVLSTNTSIVSISTVLGLCVVPHKADVEDWDLVRMLFRSTPTRGCVRR
jgi:hypothetical protein